MYRFPELITKEVDNFKKILILRRRSKERTSKTIYKLSVDNNTF